MSGQKTRKVIMGSSRNYARDRNDKPLTDDADCDASHDSKSCIIFSEQTNMTCLNPSENKSVPISEAKESKRKLGSTRRNRGRLEGNESTAMTKHESGEEVDGDSSRRDDVMTYFTSRPIAQDTMETKRDSIQSQKSVKLPLSSNVESEIMLPITQESPGDETNISDGSLSAQCDKEMTIETLSQNTSQIPSERCELLEKCDPDAGDKVIKEGKVTSEPIQMATPAAQENNNLQVGSENHTKLTKNKDISSSTVAGVSFESGDTAMINSLEAGSKSSMLQCKADTMNDNETASDHTPKSIFCKSNEINLKDSLQLNALSCEIGLEVGNDNTSVDMKISNTHISDGQLILTVCDEMLYKSEQNSSVCLKSPEKHVNQNEYTISEKTKKKRKFGSTRKDLRNNDGVKNAMDGQDIDATVLTAFQGDKNKMSELITGPHDSSVQPKDKELEETNENTDIVESQDYEFEEVDRSSLMQVSSSKECLDFIEEIQEVLHQGGQECSSIAQIPKQNMGPTDNDDTTDKSVHYIKKNTEEKHLEQEVDIESDKIDSIISKDFEAFDESTYPEFETATIIDNGAEIHHNLEEAYFSDVANITSGENSKHNISKSENEQDRCSQSEKKKQCQTELVTFEQSKYDSTSVLEPDERQDEDVDYLTQENKEDNQNHFQQKSLELSKAQSGEIDHLRHGMTLGHVNDKEDQDTNNTDLVEKNIPHEGETTKCQSGDNYSVTTANSNSSAYPGGITGQNISTGSKEEGIEQDHENVSGVLKSPEGEPRKGELKSVTEVRKRKVGSTRRNLKFQPENTDETLRPSSDFTEMENYEADLAREENDTKESSVAHDKTKSLHSEEDEQPDKILLSGDGISVVGVFEQTPSHFTETPQVDVNPSVDMKISNTHISDGLLSLTSCDEMLYTSEQNSSVCLKSPEKHVNQNEYTISEKTKKKRKFGSTRKDLRNNDGIKNAMDGQDIDATVPTAFQGDENEVSELITGPHDSSVQPKDKELEETNENTDIVESQDYEFEEVDRSSLMQVSSSKECLDFKEEIQEVLHQGDKEHSSIAQSPKQNMGPMDIDDTTDKSVHYIKKNTEEKHLEQEVDIESDKIDAIISKDFEAFDEGMSPILETASIFDSIKDNSSICVTPQENYASQKEITNLEKKEKKRKFGSKRKNPRNDSELKYKVEEKDNDTTLPTDFDKDPNNFTKVILFCKENSELTASTHPVCVEHSVKFESKSSGLYDGHVTEIQISDHMHRQSYKMNEGAYKNTSETSETILNTGDNHSQEYCESASDRSGKDMDQNNEFLTGELMATASGQVSHITIVQEASNVTGMLDINVSESQTNLIPDKTMRRRRKMGSTRRIHKVQAEIEHIIERWETGSGLSEMDSDDAGLMALDSDSDRKQKVSNSNVEVVGEKEVEESSQIISHTFTTMDHHEFLDVEHQFAQQTSPAESNPFHKVDANSEYQSPGRRRKMGSTRKVLANRVKQGIQKDHSSDGADGSDIKDAQVVDSTSGHKGVIAPLSTDAPAHREYSPFDFPGGTVLPEQVNHMQEQDPRSHIQFQEQIDADLTNIENRPPLDPLKCGPAGGSRGLVPGSHYYNVVMVGNSNVGKTSCIKRVQSGMFSPDLCASIGIDTCMHSIMVDKKLVTLQLWDTAGQERYHSITKQVFHKAHAFLLMYDITSYQSFSDIRYWAACLKEGASDDLIVMLLGNKNECTKRQVNTADGASLAKEYDFMFMECSVATGANVTLSMETLARVLHQNMQNTQRGTLVLDTKTPQNKFFGCC